MNNVVLAICLALIQESVIALRFNFRRVGKSDGDFAAGIGEQEDIKAAISFTLSSEKANPKGIGLAGYSFGANAALSVAPYDERIQAMAAISPPISTSGLSQLEGYLKPKLFLCGDRDCFVSAPELTRSVQALPEPKRCRIIPGADHFWWGYEEQIADEVAAFFVDSL